MKRFPVGQENFSIKSSEIFSEYYSLIRAIDVNRVRTKISYSHWERRLEVDEVMTERLGVIKNKVGDSVNRKEIVNFYADSTVSLEIKFMLAMIWGHEATEGGRRDGRGPWKLMKMFENREATDLLINEVSLDTSKDLRASYKSLSENVARCGPNFFTKHFYFLGKALGVTNYPLIFDDRVANGIIQRLLLDSRLLSLVTVSTARRPEAYLDYLSMAYQIAQSAQAEPDQVELFFFGQES